MLLCPIRRFDRCGQLFPLWLLQPYRSPLLRRISFSYLLGSWIKQPFRWIFCLVIFVGATLKVEEAWSIGDVFNGMMAAPNLIGLIGLAGLAAASVKGYLKKMDSLKARHIRNNE